MGERSSMVTPDALNRPHFSIRSPPSAQGGDSVNSYVRGYFTPVLPTLAVERFTSTGMGKQKSERYFFSNSSATRSILAA